MADKDLSDLFVDIYYAENQTFRSLPKMAKAAAIAQRSGKDIEESDPS